MSPSQPATCCLVSFVLLLCFVCLFNFTHAAVGGYYMDLLIGSNYTNGLTAAESNPRFSSTIEYKLLYIDRRNDDLYYSVASAVIRKVDKNGMVTNIAGSLRNPGNAEDFNSFNDYYYALDRNLASIGGLIVDPLSNEVYYLNQARYLERIRNSDKKALIAAGLNTYVTEGIGSDTRIDYTTNDYARGLAINSKNEIFILQRNRITKYNIATYATSTVYGDFSADTYSQFVLSKDETFFYARQDDKVYKISLDGQLSNCTEIPLLRYIDSVDNDLYLLSENGVYLYSYANSTTTLIAGGVYGNYEPGMNATSLKINLGTTMMVSNSKLIYLTDVNSRVVLKIDPVSKQVSELFPSPSTSPQLAQQTFTAKNMTFSGSILSAVQDKTSGKVYVCDSSNNMYQWDGNYVTRIQTTLACKFLALDPLGKLFVVSDYSIYQYNVNDNSSIRIAGNGIRDYPVEGSLANQTSLAPEVIGFFSNGNIFVQNYMTIYQINRSSNIINQYFTHPESIYFRTSMIDSSTDILYLADGSGITMVFPNSTSVLIAGQVPQLNRRRLIDGEEDGEGAFSQQISATSMAIGPADGKLYYTDVYRIRSVENGVLWTRHFIDSQQGPMDATYINNAILLGGRYNDSGIMLTNSLGNLLVLRPVAEFTCFGESPNSMDVCSGRKGLCVGPNRCECTTNSGLQCQYSTCNDVQGYEYQKVCGGKGTCSAFDVCSCPPGLSGLECATPLYYFCNGIPSTNTSKVCSGRGSCVGTDECSCNAGSYGDVCQYDFCASSWNSVSDTLACAAAAAGSVEVNQELVHSFLLNSKVLKFSRNPSVSITFPSDFYNYVMAIYPDIAYLSQLTVISSIFDPSLDTSKDLLVVGPIVSLSLFKNTTDLLPVFNLQTPITIQYDNIKIGKSSGAFNYSCQYYDTASNSWTSSGIRSTITASEKTASYYSFSLKCETYHLTSFSVIDMNYKKAARDDTINMNGLTTGGIVAIAVTLSATCLICVIIAVVVAAISGVCWWTKHSKKKNMLNQ